MVIGMRPTGTYSSRTLETLVHLLTVIQARRQPMHANEWINHKAGRRPLALFHRIGRLHMAVD